MKRRNFLGLAAAAAPMIFVPKLIIVSWKPTRSMYIYEEICRKFRSEIVGTYTPDIETRAFKKHINILVNEGVKLLDLPPGSGEIKFEPA